MKYIDKPTFFTCVGCTEKNQGPRIQLKNDNFLCLDCAEEISEILLKSLVEDIKNLRF